MNHSGSAQFSNGHVRVLSWNAFPLDYLENAMEQLERLQGLDDGIKDHEELWYTESLADYPDEPKPKKKKRGDAQPTRRSRENYVKK